MAEKLFYEHQRGAMEVSMTNADQELVRSEEQMQKAKGRRKNKIEHVNQNS
jgi:hypothetical protein